ncbi:hypothetical protein B2J93_365 [Marssonina coronariae]|uniref:Uncharacterized protein n=1 Tax=Diplocarpon coronariae TaxID=2795749 RepID=A0A218ZAG4_9HELO|nr:hypothetical protein B2J93_365 [Marssonina coronariae]
MNRSTSPTRSAGSTVSSSSWDTARASIISKEDAQPSADIRNIPSNSFYKRSSRIERELQNPTPTSPSTSNHNYSTFAKAPSTSRSKPRASSRTSSIASRAPTKAPRASARTPSRSNVGSEFARGSVGESWFRYNVCKRSYRRCKEEDNALSVVGKEIVELVTSDQCYNFRIGDQRKFVNRLIGRWNLFKAGKNTKIESWARNKLPKNMMEGKTRNPLKTLIAETGTEDASRKIERAVKATTRAVSFDGGFEAARRAMAQLG